MILVENLSIIPLEKFLEKNAVWDIFITCGSFENRCLRSCDIFINKKVKFNTSIIFKYPENDAAGVKEKNISKMKEMLELISNESYIFESESISLPSDGIKKFLAFLKKKNLDLNNLNIVFDISVFTKPYFFLLFKAIKERTNMRRFHVIYTETKDYRDYPLDFDTNEIILTEGLDRIESMPGFIGSTVNLEDALIVIIGFEGKRSLEIFHSIDPEISYCIDGYPSLQPGWHRKSMEANMRFLDESGAHQHLFFAPANDPFETNKVLGKIVMEIKKSNPDLGIIIAPLGTKMQAMGVLFYHFINSDVRVVYPFPSSFTAFYSKECGKTWIFKADLDRLGKANY
jgi:hypothetical protein